MGGVTGRVEGSSQGCMAGWPCVSGGADWKTSTSAKNK